MNRKFSDIGRLMRSHRHMYKPGRGLRFNTGGAAATTGAAVLEFPKVEIPASFSLANPGKDVPDALEKVRATMVELDKRGALTTEAFSKIAADMTAIREMAKEAQASTRHLLREVPGPQESTSPLKLRRIPLSLKTAGEIDGQFSPEFNKLDRNGRVGLVQYNLLTRTEDELGITDPGDRIQLRRLKALHDATTMINLSRSHDASYFANGGQKSLPWYAEQMELAKKFIGALADGNSTEGLEWIQVNLLSSTIQELIEVELEFSRVFGVFPMRAATVKWPVMGVHAEAQFLTENLVDAGTTTNAVSTPDSWATTDKTYTARKFAASVVLSSEWEEDAIVNAPLYAQTEQARLLARAREKTIINGQRTAAIDGGSIAATSILNMWDGLRYMFRQTGKTAVDLSSGITSESLAAMFGAQGAPGSKVRDCAWLTGTSGFARLLIAKSGDNSPLFLTMAQAGNQATAMTGALGMVFGRPVYVSEFVSEQMQADGTLDDVTTPTGTKTALYHMYHRCMKIGQRRGVMVSRSDELRFLADQIVFKATAREDFESNVTPSASAPLVMEGNNIASF